MIEKAESISVLLSDYENNQMTAEHVLDWVSQFDGGDHDFILEELLHIFKQTYFSKSKCRQLLKSYVEFWTKEFNYATVASFIEETVFLDLQPAYKSQRELLDFTQIILYVAQSLSKAIMRYSIYWRKNWNKTVD